MVSYKRDSLYIFLKIIKFKERNFFEYDDHIEYKGPQGLL